MFMKKVIMLLFAISFLQQKELSAQSPSITCPANQTVQASANTCNAIVNNLDPVISPAGTEYSYHILSTGQSGYGSASGNTFPVGVNIVVYTLTDYPDVECTVTVTVEDKTPPVFQCPPNLTVKCLQDIPLPTDITAMDACAGIVGAQFVSDVRSNEICSN